MSILAAVVRDDSSYTAVLDAASALAGSDSFEVLSLYPSPASHEEVRFHSPAEKTAAARAAVKEAIEADLKARSLDGLVNVPVARLYNLGDNIVEHAQEMGATLVVIGTHGRSGLSRLFLGSVAERVVRHAHCDVYVARPQRSD